MGVNDDSGELTGSEWKRRNGMELLETSTRQTAVAKDIGINRRTVCK